MGFLDKIFKRNRIVSHDEQREVVTTSTTNNQVQMQLKFEPNSQQVQIPELQGDYAKTLFLNAYQKASPVKSDSQYQRYLIYECGIKEPSKYHLRMIEEGYLEKSSLVEILRSLKVDELKTILDELGQKKVGKKEELIQRIVDNSDINQITQRYSQDTYCISLKGKQFLEQNINYIKIHQHSSWGINWKEYDKRKNPGYSFYDTVWRIFNERILHSVSYGRNEYYNMYELLLEEGRRKDALEKLLLVLYIDISGIEGENIYKLFKQRVYTKKQTLEYFNIAVMIVPKINETIKTFKDVYDDTIVERIYEAYKLPVQLCNKELFLEIIHSSLDHNYDVDITTRKLRAKYVTFINSL